MDSENIYDKIQEIFGNVPGNYSILEERIDIDLQMEYFECSKSVKADLNPESIISHKDDIFDEKLSEETRKHRFAELASIENVEAYRTIEKYVKSSQRDLKSWAILAFQESRMLLESKILNENQVFISTGLGGKGGKLRYFIVLISKTFTDLSALNSKIIKNEIEFAMRKYDADIEQIKFEKCFATLLAIIPLNVPIKKAFRDVVQECNQYGNFLESNFIVTNVKELTIEEIKDFLIKQKQAERDSDR